MVIEPAVCILWALMLLLLPLNWLISAFAAAAFHEFCHYIVARFLKVPIGEMRIDICGMKLEVSGLTYDREFLCAAAGPVGGAALLLLYRIWPRLSLCALIQSAFNLLPFYPLDGGRMTYCLCCMFTTPESSRRICLALQWTCAFAILLAGLCFFRGNVPVIAVVYLILRMLWVKIPCKEGELGLQ